MSSRSGKALVLLVATACGRPDATASPVGSAPDAASAAAIDASPAADATIVSLDAPLPWTESLRLARWADAEASIAKLPDAERAKAEVRLARGRIALAEGRHADVLKHLDKIDDELPLLRDLVSKLRAHAALEVGPYDKAAEWFGARSQVGAWVTSAEAWQKAGDSVRAKIACDRVASADKRPRRHEEKARAIRMRILRLKEGDPKAVDDARWLAINALDDASAIEALEVLEKAPAAQQLRVEDRMTRARLLADALRADDAIKEIERAATMKNAPSTGDVCRAKAEALFKARTRYPEAAVAYKQCVPVDPAHAAEDLFLSARASLRADRDADAITAFQHVMQRHPRTVWADQAEFLVARQHVLTGKWKEAMTAFDEYVKRWPTGKERREADRYRALSHLMAQEHKSARRLLEERAGSTEDAVEQARWINLAALAALRDGDKLHATARWAEVARSKPLTWPALVARARLLQNGLQIPAAIEPPESGSSEPLAVELPPPVDLLHRIGLDGEAEEALREREGVVVSRAQGRGTEALCAAYGILDRGKRRYVTSLGIPGQLFTTAPGGRNRWAWECSYPRPYKSHVRAREKDDKLPADLVWAVMRQESNFDPDAVSPARAVGLMQLLPETAKTTAQSVSMKHEESWLTSAEHNITLGALYLRELLDKLGANVPLAVAAYNAGPEAIQRWLSHGKGESIDVFVEAIPFLETRGYVVRVMGNLARYGFMDRGEGGVPAIALDLK